MTGPELILIGIIGGLGCIFIVDFTKKWCKKDSCTAVMWAVLAAFIVVMVGIAATGI